MINRTVLEWGRLSYKGDGPGTIPQEAADKIAAAAALSSFAGKNKIGVVDHGRYALHAKNIVGIIAAEGCSLEILPKIDFGNEDPTSQEDSIRRKLIDMLAICLDIDIDAGRTANISRQQHTLLEVLIGVFADKLTDAVKRGMPRQYIKREEDLRSLRGSLNIVRQFTVHAANPSTLACRFNSLSEDIALNRVMKAVVTKLRRMSSSPENQIKLTKLSFIYADVSDVLITKNMLDTIIIDRTNKRWRDLLAMAKLFLDNQFQTTSSGDSRGFTLLFDMNDLFEKYVYRLIRRALARTPMHVIAQGGRRFCLTEKISEKGAFQTQLDILVKRGNDTVWIIDTKWKRIPPKTQTDKSTQGINQGDVYQMMAYRQVYDSQKLMLLYPHHARLDENGESEGCRESYRITNSDSSLVTATFDIANSLQVTERLQKLLDLQEMP